MIHQTLRSIRFDSKRFLFQQSTLDRKKKNFTFSRKFPFMKSKDDKNEDGSDQERKQFLIEIKNQKKTYEKRLQKISIVVLVVVSVISVQFFFFLVFQIVIHSHSVYAYHFVIYIF